MKEKILEIVINTNDNINNINDIDDDTDIQIIINKLAKSKAGNELANQFFKVLCMSIDMDEAEIEIINNEEEVNLENDG